MQTQTLPYARSPAPAGVGGATTPFPAASPAGAGAGALHSYTPSPQHTPYSQHSSPAPPSRTPTYADSHHYAHPVSPRPARLRSCPHPRAARTHTLRPQAGSAGSGSGSYGAELGGDIAAGIASPPPVSPGMAVDFEPPAPRQEGDARSPMGSTDMHPGSNSNSSLGDYNKVGRSLARPRALARHTEPCANRPRPQANPGAGEMSPGVGAAFGGALFDGERLPYRTQHALSPDKDHYYAQDQGRPRGGPRAPAPGGGSRPHAPSCVAGAAVADSPRLDQMHQHQMYPAANFSRCVPTRCAPTPLLMYRV